MPIMKRMRTPKGDFYMIVRGEAFSQRIAQFSNSTMQLIMDSKTDKETSKKINLIVANTDYTEEQVVEKIKELLKIKK